MSDGEGKVRRRTGAGPIAEERTSPASSDFASGVRDPTDPETAIGDDSPFARRLAPYTLVGDASGRPGRVALIDGRYRILELIGRGSMGRIYLAEQTAVGRRIALKIINRELTDKADMLARFQQEARLLAKAQNPHVVEVYDIGETADHDPFIAMEYVDGPSLASVIKREAPLDPVRALRILLQMAGALDAVHRAGVVHRDLKPANVVLLARGGAEIVKILDFGLAKIVHDREAGGRLTRAGGIVGTPEYMSPEQVRGGQVDHRADLYSLGCTAYEMLVGAPPFTGEEMATLYKHLHDPPTPPRRAAPSAEIPAAVEKVVMRLLEKDPAARYADAAALRTALLAAADEAEIPRRALRIEVDLDDLPAEPPSSGGLRATAITRGVPPPAARRRFSLEAALLAAIALVVGLAAGLYVARGRGGDAPAATPPAAPPPPLAAELLLVDSRPAGARVELDGQPLDETTPTAVRGVAVGRHRVTLRLAGHADVDRDVEIAPGARAVLSVTLPPVTRQVTVRTIPTGADLYLDDRLIGRSPAVVELVADEFHELRAEKLGFEPTIRRVAPEETADAIDLPLEPERLPRGRLTIDSAAEAEVWLDGVETGLVTPIRDLRVAAGPHTLELRDPAGGRTRALRIEIRQGETLRLTVNLDD